VRVNTALISVSSVVRLEPFNDEHPCEFRITYEAPDDPRVSHFTVDTEQSAAQWRKAFEGALFRHARIHWRKNEAIRRGAKPEDFKETVEEWTMMRCCVPLNIVTIKGVQDYHSFATLVGLDIDLGDREMNWRPEKIAEGDFSYDNDRRQSKHKAPNAPEGDLTGNDGRRPSKTKDIVRSATSFDAPRRSFSIKKSLPFANSRASSPGRQPERTPSFNLPFGKKTESPRESPEAEFPPIRREQTKWIDTTVPPRLAQATKNQTVEWEAGHDGQQRINFNVAVLNEQSWFVEALEAGVAAAGQRKLRPGAKTPKMSLDVAGYDCLATDEEIEADKGMPRTSTSSSEEDTGPQATREMRKSQKASMAAKVFGLNEDEGIWRKWH